MKKLFILCFLLLFYNPFSVFAADDTATIKLNFTVQEKIGIEIQNTVMNFVLDELDPNNNNYYKEIEQTTTVSFLNSYTGGFTIHGLLENCNIGIRKVRIDYFNKITYYEGALLNGLHVLADSDNMIAGSFDWTFIYKGTVSGGAPSEAAQYVMTIIGK